MARSNESSNTNNGEIYLNQIYEFLSTQEKKVADFIKVHKEDVLAYSIAEIAQGSGSSESTVVRFCKSLGYSGLKNFKIHFFSGCTPKEQEESKIEWDDDDATIVQKIYTGCVSSLEKTFTSLEASSVTSIANLLYEKRNVDIYGVGGSASIATYAKHKFQKLGMRINVYFDLHGQDQAFFQFSEEDLVIAISCSGETKEIVEAITWAKKAGATIIVLTNAPESTLGKLADHAIYAVGDAVFCNDINSYSRLSQLAIINVLYQQVANRVAKNNPEFKEAYAIRTKY